MGLTFPLNVSQSKSQISQNNLSILLCCKNTNEEISSEAVRTAFQDYQNAELGFGHYAKKFTASVAVYGAVLGLPVTTAIGTTYWFLKDYIKNPLSLGKDLGLAILNNHPAIDPNAPIIGKLSSYTTPAFCLGTLCGITIVDRIFHERVGISPIKSVTKWSVSIMSTVLLYAAYKAGEIASASYLQEEEESNTSRKFSHQKIIDDLKCIYDHIAEGFFNEYEKVFDTPKDRVRFRNMALQLEENLPYIKSKLEELELKTFEINQILNKLSASISAIKDSALELRQTRNENDVRFNIELLTTLPTRDIPSIAISKDIKNHIKIANCNDYGVLHTIYNCAEAAAKGMIAAVVADLAISTFATVTAQWAGVSTTNLTSFHIGAATVGALPSISLGMDIASKVMETCGEERLNAELRKEEQLQIAYEKLSDIYDGIAAYLTRELNKSHYNPFAMDMLRAKAKDILTKLPLLEAEIAKVNVMPNRLDITEKLRAILVTLA